MGQSKEYIQRFELSKYRVEELLDYQMIMKNSFFKNKSKSEIEKLLGTLAIAVAMKPLGFSKAISALASIVK